MVLCGCASTASAPTSTPYTSASPDPYAALAQRPLNLPAAEAGTCPAASGRQVNPGFGDVLGDGPVYAVRSGGIGSLNDGTDWLGEKVLWVASPDFTGHAIVRGGRIDAPGEMSFDSGPPEYEMQFDTVNGRYVRPVGPAGADWYNWATYTRVKEPGCYAYQVDRDAFSYTIVFRAVLLTP
jgi:hypothetical protein